MAWAAWLATNQRCGKLVLSDYLPSLKLYPGDTLTGALQVTGISMPFGQAMGLDEAVMPVLPNSDFCTGVCRVVGALDGLLRRAKKGGSYCISVCFDLVLHLHVPNNND